MAAAGMAPAAEVLVWHDEFEGEALDGARWTAEQGLVRNDRAAQLYRADPANLTVADGVLRLTATFDAAGYPNPFYGKNGWEDWRSYIKSKPYASGSVNSFGKFSMRYGRVAVRARFSVASGAWPAIWMLGTAQTPPGDLADAEAFWRAVSTVPWPQCGEIGRRAGAPNHPFHPALGRFVDGPGLQDGRRDAPVQGFGPSGSRGGGLA